MNDVHHHVKTIVARYLDIPLENVVETADLKEDLGADSLEIAEIVMAFEEEFGLEIEDGKIDEMSTVGDVIKFLERTNA